MREHKLDELNLDDLAEELDSTGGERAPRTDEPPGRAARPSAEVGAPARSPDDQLGRHHPRGAPPDRARDQAQPKPQAFLPEAVADVYPDAVERAVYETGFPEHLFARECPYSLDQILDKTFYPGEN